MAIGFPAYHEETARFRNVSREALHRAAEDAIDALGWSMASRGPLAAGRVGAAEHAWRSSFMWGERLIVEVEDGELRVRSEGSIPLQWLDFGKHRTNINQFLRRVEDFLDA